MARDFGPFPTKPMYEVVNRRMQRSLALAGGSATGFTKVGQGAVTAGTGAQLVIAAYPDGALVDGLYVENPASETVTLTTNTNSNPRIDRLVMRLDVAAETIAPFQIVGTPAASPSAPPLVQTAAVYDMPLVQYRFPGSASAQNPGSIVDERVYGGALSSTALTLTTNYTSTGAPWGAPLVIQQGIKMRLQGSVTNSTSSFSATGGTLYQIGSFNSGLAPASTPQEFTVAFGNGATFAGAAIQVRSNGTVWFRPYSSVSITSIGQLSLSVSGVEWLVGL